MALAPALACLDGLAGESVEAACEKAVFGSADTAAAAVSYAAGQVSRVIAASNARTLTPEQQVLKRAVERDRYGLVAQVVTIRDRCVVTDCPLFRAVSDANQIKANMNDRLYDALVTRYSPSWTSAAAMPAAGSSAAGLLPGCACKCADRPADDGRLRKLGLDPAGQHHDGRSAGAAGGSGSDAAVEATGGDRRRACGEVDDQCAGASQAAGGGPANDRGTVAAPAASIGRPRVVAPVPFVPSQVGDDN